ncbi:hypothetical protein LWI28_008081 [Acer negundo]|uniref:Retrotransposon Copia-like N-terminal domain-containing protein n=1 Tax=Acer negundo TaxID=4023 RepID=A0AAD5IYE6_ACENE|nr:hypothetical protein LWI28_008081 [Acer negundo]
MSHLIEPPIAVAAVYDCLQTTNTIPVNVGIPSDALHRVPSISFWCILEPHHSEREERRGYLTTDRRIGDGYELAMATTEDISFQRSRRLNGGRRKEDSFWAMHTFLSQISNMTDPKDFSSMNPTSDSQGSIDPLSAQGPNDPFFVHHSDNPTTVLVSPMLSGDNYNTWLRSISRALRAKNKLGFVDGTIQPPTDLLEKSKWSRCDDLVASWVLNYVTLEIHGSILYANFTHDIWKDLSDHFSQSNAPKIYQLKQSISSLKQDNVTVLAYYSLLKSLRDELNSLSTVITCTCGHGHAAAARVQGDRAIEFLQGLHDPFSAIRS